MFQQGAKANEEGTAYSSHGTETTGCQDAKERSYPPTSHHI